jgi:hypothetical protein
VPEASADVSLTADSSTADSSTTDSGADGADAAATFNALTDLTRWSAIDLSASANFGTAGSGFEGAVFDGHGVFLAPHDATFAFRHDPASAFDAKASWAGFGVSTTSAGTSGTGFEGTVFDGTYVYFVPWAFGASGTIVRYDTGALFGVAASWQSYDLAANVDATAHGFVGGAFDGRYVYLVPGPGGAAVNTRIARYDIHQPFGAKASWTTFDLATLNAGDNRYADAAFDGRYLYLVPVSSFGSGSIVARYDTTLPVDVAASWTTYDVHAGVSTNLFGLEGAVFDGRYLYFGSSPSPTSTTLVVARFDTQGVFASSSSWTTFVLSGVSGVGGTHVFEARQFDGRYVYFAPLVGSVLARFDTQGMFGDGASWTAFDVAGVRANAGGFGSATLDGRYLYLVPATNGIVAGFDARTPPMIPQPTASFF